MAIPACVAALLLSSAARAEPKCPAGLRPSLHGCVAGAPSARRAATTTSAQRSALPPEPSVQREGAVLALEQIERRSLIQELGRLEKLLQATARNSPDRAMIMRRLAEGYAELERRAAQDGEIAKLRARRARQDRAPKGSTATF